MQQSRTWRGVAAAAVAAVLAIGMAPMGAVADDALPEPERLSEQIAADRAEAGVEEPATPAPEQVPTPAELLPSEQDATADEGTATEEQPAPDADATQEAPAAIAPMAASVTSLKTEETWDYFRGINVARIDRGYSPMIQNGTLNTLAQNWVRQGRYALDYDIENKIPVSWGVGVQEMMQVYANSAAEAVTVAQQKFLADSDIISSAVLSDLGFGVLEMPFVSYSNRYLVYIIAFQVPHSVAQAGEMTLYRFYRPSTGTHFYSTSASERNTVARNAAYRYEGQVAYVLQPNVTTSGTSNLNRFYQPSSGTHFYTSSVSEYNRVRTFPQYSLDGVAGKVYTKQVSGVTPMFRFFRPASGTHFYTANASEVATVKNMPGYTYEGVAFYLRKAS